MVQKANRVRLMVVCILRGSGQTLGPELDRRVGWREVVY